MLYKILAVLRECHESHVLSLLAGGALVAPIAGLGIPVQSLNMQRARPAPGDLWALRRHMRRLRPDLVQGWMYHGNLAATLACLTLRRPAPVVWNIRHSPRDLQDQKPGTRWTIHAGAWLSRRPAAVIYNARAGAERHRELGFRPRRTEWIPNGFDMDLFQPSEAAWRSVREELGLAPDAVLVGLMGRYHPVKDHEGFLEAAAAVRRARPDVHVVLAGRGVVPEEPFLAAALARPELAGALFLLGERSDMPRLTAALDVAVCASKEESFPNVLGEAMACGVLCVSTDVGDTREIVGETGVLVPPRRPDLLAAGLLEVLALPAAERGERSRAARRRIETRYSLAGIAGRYDALYRQVLETTR